VSNKKNYVLLIGVIGFILIFVVEIYKTKYLSFLNKNINFNTQPYHLLIKAQHFFDKAYFSNDKTEKIKYLNLSKAFLNTFKDNEAQKAVSIINEILKTGQFTKHEKRLFYKEISNLSIKTYKKSLNNIKTLDNLKEYINQNAIYTEFLIFLLTSAILTTILLLNFIKFIKEASAYDQLTKAYNRKKFHEIKNTLPHPKNAIILLDIDHFKRINDTYGHSKGDEVLKTIVKIIKQHIRKEDYVIRWGGEEFLIIIHDTSQEKGYKIAETLRKKIEKHDFNGIEVTASFGVKECEDYITEEDINLVDKALYKAKEKRNSVVTI
jgi:polar amino acid transport system substrate-binding protein